MGIRITNGVSLTEKLLTKVCLEVIKDAPRILRGYHLTDPRMDDKSILLMVLYDRLRSKLGLKPKQAPIYPDCPTHEWAYRDQLISLFEFECKMDPPFKYDPIIDKFLSEALRRKGN